MTDKAYIVTNKRQEMAVLEELEREGYLWRGTDMKPTEQQPRIIDEPITIFAQDGKRLGFDYEVNEVYLSDYEVEIDFDGRKEEQMSDKYVVSHEFMNKLYGWKIDYVANSDFLDIDNIGNLPPVVSRWWVYADITDKERNNRLIAIIRWVNGEDVFEVEKPKKWVVRSKETDSEGSHLYVNLSKAINIPDITTYFGLKTATKFDTKEEADSWANSHQEVIQVEVDE